MSDEVRRFTLGQEWRGCWDCLQAFANCTHLDQRQIGVATALRVSKVEPDKGTITVSAEGG